MSLFSFQDIITSLSGILILLVLIMAVQVAIEKVEAIETVDHEMVDDAHIVHLRELLESLKAQLRLIKEQPAGDKVQDTISMARNAIRIEQDNEKRIAQLVVLSNEYARISELLKIKVEELARITNALNAKEAEQSIINAEYNKIVTGNRLFLIPDKASSKIPIVVECGEQFIRMGYLDRKVPPQEFTADDQGVNAFKRALEGISSTTHYFVFFVKPSGINSWRRYYNLVIKDYDVGYDALEEDATIALGTENI